MADTLMRPKQTLEDRMGSLEKRGYGIVHKGKHLFIEYPDEGYGSLTVDYYVNNEARLSGATFAGIKESIDVDWDYEGHLVVLPDQKNNYNLQTKEDTQNGTVEIHAQSGDSIVRYIMPVSMPLIGLKPRGFKDFFCDL